MSIEVNNLSKRYGQQLAVDALSFSITAGQVVGFLGPNGAGKSTTMKVLTGYLAPTSGTALVAGQQVRTDDPTTRQHIGYLPEHNPLYLDMYVRELLAFVAGLHRLSGLVLNQRIANVIEQTGLGSMQHKLVGQLSKGYRQRVGLAAALIHNPQVLILDEPTSGLDPNQVQEIRQLIRDLGREKTVLFSSHIMQEVEAVASRVLIIHQGQLRYDAPLGAGVADTEALEIRFAQPGFDTSAVQQDSGVLSLQWASPSTLLLTVQAAQANAIRQLVLQQSLAQQHHITHLAAQSQNLERVFREITGANQ